MENYLMEQGLDIQLTVPYLPSGNMRMNKTVKLQMKCVKTENWTDRLLKYSVVKHMHILSGTKKTNSTR